MACTISGRSLEAVPFPHRNFATNPDVIGIVNDAIHDGFRYRAVIIRIGIDAFIPAFHLVLCAEDNGTFLTAGFDNLKQIIGFLEGVMCPTLTYKLIRNKSDMIKSRIQ